MANPVLSPAYQNPARVNLIRTLRVLDITSLQNHPYLMDVDVVEAPQALDRGV